ncbi:3-keto-5-aminohexanoate cleavage protein [Sneathiella glossodoripedis]|uniref:3-keto-5-aminohexanoate cleavage protein n=1 Tax=Sneathiella glossodoripedis TaxID=418853 RepID=UPI00055A122F|nr:3-keto-5-aminohexanoate cleavage protein [Sneathiella glossodoripedis]
MITPMLDPLSIMVAPNGARKMKKDHPALPMTPDELANEAYNCMQAGASAIHLHVRDAEGKHSLDVGLYQDAIAAVQEKCGAGMLVQATSEAVGIYSANEQMDMVLKLKPPSVSLAIRELVPIGGESAAAEFFTQLHSLSVIPQFILYDSEDVKRFNRLREEGVLPDQAAFLLFVLGRYAEGQVSKPADLLPFLAVRDPRDHWSVCAFGPLENVAASAAIALGGHVRVGFENNLLLKGGEVASSNADLVQQVSEVSRVIGRPLATAEQLENLVSGNM